MCLLGELLFLLVLLCLLLRGRGAGNIVCANDGKLAGWIISSLERIGLLLLLRF